MNGQGHIDMLLITSGPFERTRPSEAVVGQSGGRSSVWKVVCRSAFALAISAFYAADVSLFLRYPDRPVIGYKRLGDIHSVDDRYDHDIDELMA
jgi:hypothetical protein